ncbi:MAG: DNA-directed DNA polymerase II large subunit [Candidatus Thermoplasmatota archaeon]|nr:DNA-directed DNA polymerase II large subunit [Candidatus Thermoplasmatota archaeon]
MGGIITSELAHSEKIADYFRSLEEEAENCYEIAEKARSLGYDPNREVEIPRAEDLALRAQKLTGVENTAEKIRELSEKYDREEVSIRIAKEVASRDEGSVAGRLEDAVRIGLAVLTEGILVAPLEGIGGVDIRENNDGSNYVELSFAGPIRSAGGTGQAMSVLIADVVRRELGFGRFKPTPSEIQRFKEEIPLYKKSLGLQYTPTAEEISLIVDGCPVSISGEGTGQEEVSGNRDLPRVETNQVRGGACLVIAEGMCLKAKKLKKHVEKLAIEGWDFLDEYIDEYASGKKDESGDEEGSKKGVAPRTKYIQETIAGRPVFGHPSEKGGFRLRYGRTRTEGLASIAVNPATMYVTDEFMALGTQVKTERPGKAGAITPCDSIEGPTVLFKDGSVKRIDSPEEGKERQKEVEEVIDLGEVLIPFGEFVENNHPLVPGSYCHEWWIQEVEEDFEEKDITSKRAVELSREKDYPLHPKFTYFWDYVSIDDIKQLRDWVSNKGEVDEEALILPDESYMKGILESIGIPHEVEDHIIISVFEPFLFSLGLNEENLTKIEESESDKPLEYISELAGVTVRSKGPTNIGSRMARPEKAKERKMSPPVHGLFPLGEAGGSERLIKKAVEKNVIEVDISARRCQKCGKGSAQIRCSCGGRCEIVDEPKEQKIPMKSIYRQALNTLGEGGNIKKIKGVKGLITETKTPEALEKPILRAKHDIYVFKDGTSRYDMTDLPLTHFKPEEVGLTVDQAKDLGYEEDIEGRELEEEDQMLELKPQDMVISKEAGEYMVKVANFVDDLLEKYYDLANYYNAEDRTDLIGELVVGLAPHTSGGVLGRIIGFHNGRAGYAHPHFHAAKRRNCLPGDMEVKMVDGSTLELEELYNTADHEEEMDCMGTTGKEIDRDVLTAVEEKINSSKASKVIRTPAPEFKIEFKTQAGRKLEVFPDHRMKTADGVKKARELEKGDQLLTPLEIDVRTKDRDHIRLDELLSDSEDVMIRRVNEKVDKAIEGLGGLVKASETLDVQKKILGNYRYRESIPLELYMKLMEMGDIENTIPDTAILAAKRDTVEIPFWIDIDSDFMKLLGFYLSEGYARKSEKEGKQFYQVCFAFAEKEMKENIRDTINKVFKIEPSEGENVLTISSRLVYEFFQELEMGLSAKEKRVPNFVKSLPKEKVSDLIAAYFAGDGSVESGCLHVQATSASRKLLDDIDFLLKRFGIYARYSQSEREAGGVLLEKYGENHYEGRTFLSNKLHIRSSHSISFGKKIGFTLERKQRELEKDYSLERKPRVEIEGKLVREKIKTKEIRKSDEEFMYDIEVEDTHNFVTRDNIITNNCDGDEDCIMLLLDGLLNFSEDFLPEKRGGLMDAPLVLTTKIDPQEIDSEAHNVDIAWNYPLEFYEKTLEYPKPKEVEGLIETVEDRLNREGQYENFGYTHETSRLDEAPSTSRYTRLGKMTDKMDSQIKVADLIRAVDTKDVVSRVINDHFIPDLIGNLNKFGVQQIRCTKCNTKYRRIPLSGECRCGGNLTLTIHEGSVKKYLNFSLDMVEKYEVSEYLYQRVQQLNRQIGSLFENDKVSTPSLDEFC